MRSCKPVGLASSESNARYHLGMCRSIRPLNNFDPPATPEEIRSAAIQYVRKISGSASPSRANVAAFECAVEAIAKASMVLLSDLVTTATPKNRELEVAKAHQRAANRLTR